MQIPFRLAVLDSSVVIKWFRLGEQLSAEALAIRSWYLDGVLDLAIPELLLYEVANALRYKPDLTVDDVCAAVQSLYDLDLGIVRINADHSRLAIRLARQYDVTVYDAVFLECAHHLAATLVTADEAFFRRVKGDASVIYLGDLAPTRG